MLGIRRRLFALENWPRS
ncbi:hypothetical protein RDI58_016799 [Solanum bulbocastanum]|uniref:Uncharacterized protein n=1 Tax=Solanum bulbocastanum TaxID=147425 RepID=A0AAN8YCT4_SOLBU